MTPSDEDLAVEICHDLADRALQNRGAYAEHYREKERVIRALLAEVRAMRLVVAAAEAYRDGSRWNATALFDAVDAYRSRHGQGG